MATFWVMSLTKKKFSPIQTKLTEDRKRNGDAVAPFNWCYNFVEVLVKLSLVEEMTGHTAKEVLSWRDVDSYE